ncbi:MAG: Condensin subunit ScpB [Blastococcus sp.]|nr:Condensin subunit ScpB [Blastococcus sp.]
MNGENELDEIREEAHGERDLAKAPISWDALAAELSATREESERRGDADPGTWDAVAAELAARVADRPVEESPAPSPVEDPAENEPADDVPPEDPAPPDVPAGEPALEDAAGHGADEPIALSPEELRGGLEALLFVMDNPVDEQTLAATLRSTAEEVRSGLAALAEGYDERRAGITLRRVGEGWRLYTRDEHAPVVERYLIDGQRSRLTQAALETLAVIAYRQPVTRARISAIRGVGVDGVMRTLLARGLVYEVGPDPDSGGGLYATTPLFLERLGLRGLDELPELAPLLPETATVLDEHPDA